MTRQMLMVLFALLFGLLAQCERIYGGDASTDEDQVSAVRSNGSLVEDAPPCVKPADARPAQAAAQVALHSIFRGLPEFGPCARTFKAVWDAYAYGVVTVGAIVWVEEELARNFVPNADGEVLTRHSDDSDSDEEDSDEEDEEEGSVFDGVRNAADRVRNFVHGPDLVFGLVVRDLGGVIKVDDLGYDDRPTGARFQVKKQLVRVTQLSFSEMVNFIRRQKCVRDYVKKLRASVQQAARVVHQALSHKLTSFATTGSVMLTISAGASWVGWSAVPHHAVTFSGTLGIVLWPQSVRGTAFLCACGGKGTAHYSVDASVGVFVGFSRKCFAGPGANIGVSFNGANGLALHAGHSVSGGVSLSPWTSSITGVSFSFGWEMAAKAVGSIWNPFQEELFGGSMSLCDSWEVISRGTQCGRPECSTGIMAG